jgi:6-phosphogluconolactonase
MKTFRLLSKFLPLASLALLVIACGSKQPTMTGTCPNSSNPACGTSGSEVLYSAPLTDLLNTSINAVIDPSTGGLSVVPSAPMFFFCSGGIAAVGGQFLYVSVPQSDCGGTGSAIFGYSLDQATGATTSLAGSPFVLGLGNSSEGMATKPGNNLLYVADAGAIDAFTIDSSTGVLSPLAGSPFTSGSNPELVVDPSGKFLYASDDDPPGGVFAFAIGSTGALTPIAGSPFAISGQGSNNQPLGIVDTGNFVYVALYESNQIAAFSINTETGALASVPGSPFATGTNPTVLALTPGKNFLYGINSLDGSISGFAIDTTGALTAVPGSPSGQDGATLAVDLSGSYLYVSTSAGIFDFDIDPTTGALTPGTVGLSNDGSLWMTITKL